MALKSSDNILHYFQSILECNKLSLLKDTALRELKERYGSLVDFVDEEKGIVNYWGLFSDQHSNGEPVEAIVTYDFSKEFPKEITTQTEQLKNRIDKTVNDINLNGINATEFLNTLANELTSLIEKAKIVYPKLRFIEANLLNVLTYIVDKYSLKASFKKQSKIELSKFSYFGAETKRSTLIKIFDIASDLKIFDDEVFFQDTFINVLSSNPTKTDEVIVFNCNNEIAAHFINCIQPLFNNLSIAQINKSKSFVNKQGKVLNQSDLDNANKRLRKKTSAEIDAITYHLSRIVKSK
ncbi:hypothetical protein [Patiriisocius sp. Uisw_017]|uniref:hypothetical protein n=1 Tax=Patiriisocius sp. Uisw_017 TaxID=3230968 RepID=UPI0039E7AF6D